VTKKKKRLSYTREWQKGRNKKENVLKSEKKAKPSPSKRLNTKEKKSRPHSSYGGESVARRL